MRKIKAIVKRADEAVGHMTWISDRLENLQKHVGGYIEVVPLTPGVVVICNEEGLINNLPFNCQVPRPPIIDTFFGDIIICGVDGEEFADVPISLQEWRQNYLLM